MHKTQTRRIAVQLPLKLSDRVDERIARFREQFARAGYGGVRNGITRTSLIAEALTEFLDECDRRDRKSVA